MARGLGVLFFVLLPAVWIGAVAAVEGANDGLTAHELTRYVHQLLFVYWIGPDIGVYYLSHRICDPQLSVAQRLAAAQVMGQIDLIPRVCLSLMLTVGGILTEFVGVPHPPWQMAGIVLLGPVWLTMILIIYFRRGTPLGAAVTKLDFYFRWFMIVAVVASVVDSFSTGRLDATPWVGTKLLLFAAILLFGLLMRIRVAPLLAGIGQLAADGPSDATNGMMTGSLRRTRPFVLAIWAAVLLAALTGIVKPGDQGAAATPAAQPAASVLR
jgi:hypothetical protein